MRKHPQQFIQNATASDSAAKIEWRRTIYTFFRYSCFLCIYTRDEHQNAILQEEQYFQKGQNGQITENSYVPRLNTHSLTHTHVRAYSIYEGVSESFRTGRLAREL